MYAVSAEYRQEMDAQVRECAQHCKIYLGMIDATAAGDASYTYPASEPWADPAHIADDAALGKDYAAFEAGYFRLDGKQSLMPDDTSICTTQALVSAAQAAADGVFATPPTITIAFPITHTMVGLTLDFGALPEDVPGQITAIWYAGDTQLGTAAASTGITPTYRWELDISDADKIVLRFEKAHGGYGRARLCRVTYGIGYTYQDRELYKVVEKHTDSPCCTEVPSASLSFDLDNSDGRFNAGAVAQFLAEGQKITLEYGATLSSGSDEWLPAGAWYLTGWSTSGSTASFTAEDELSRLSTTNYEKGVFDGQLHTLYSLAEAVLADAGVTEYYLDTRLKAIVSAAAIPITSHAAALQLIANAGMCRILCDRQGRVAIVQNASDPVCIPWGAESTGTVYSTEASTVTGTAINYATYSTDYFSLDGSQKLLPDTAEYLPAGWSTEIVSDESGTLSGMQLLSLNFGNLQTDIYTVEVDWGGTPPKEIAMEAYVDGSWTGKWSTFFPTKNQETYTVCFQHCSNMTVRIRSMPQAGQRGRIRYIKPTHICNVSLGTDQIFQNPAADLLTKLRNVASAWCYTSYYPGVADQVASTKISANSGVVRIEHSLCYQPVASTATEGVTLTQINYGYVSYVSASAATNIEVDIVITGQKMYQADHPISVASAETGEDLTASNPLFTGSTDSINTISWMRDYYARRIKCTPDARGYPELDCGDVLPYGADSEPAQIIGTELTYNGSFKEKFTLRKD